MTPDQKTAPRAFSQGMPMPATTVKAKKALSPMPGASTIGFLAYNPIMTLEKKLTRMVAVSRPLNGIPVVCSIKGFTMIIYMVARKVVIPASISVFKSVLFSLKLKNFSMLKFDELVKSLI